MSETPNVEVVLDDPNDPYLPGDVLVGRYRINPAGRRITMVELGVLWDTEGKGDEDLGVHHVEHREAEKGESLDLADAWQPFAVTLPSSPLSYEGFLVKIRWYARVRAEFQWGRAQMGEALFRLGQVTPVKLKETVEEELPP